MVHYRCELQESSGKQWKITLLQAMKNVRSLSVSEALTENNYAVNRLLHGRDLAALSKGRLETSLKGRSEHSHGTFWEKAGENKKTICPDWLFSPRWVILCLPGLLAARKIKHGPRDNWMGIFNRLSCDLNSAGSQALQDDQSNRKGGGSLRQGEGLAKISRKNPPVSG